jgi:hypothetical protein
LHRVPSSNRTRRYLDTVITALTLLPPAMVGAGFEKMAQDSSFSYRMRAKFAAAAEDVAYRGRASGGLDDGAS